MKCRREKEEKRWHWLCVEYEKHYYPATSDAADLLVAEPTASDGGK